NIHYRTVPRRWRRPVLNMLWHLLLLPWQLRRRRYDGVLLPAANRRALLFCRIFTVAVVHDLSQYHIPAKYDWFRMFYIKRILPWCVRRADRIVAVSKSTATDLHQCWHLPADKITVIYNGYDHRHFRPEAAPGETEMLPDNLPEHYLLYISRIEHPGKNHLNLLRAYELLPRELRQQYALVLAGKVWPGAEPVLDYAAESPAREEIHFIGFVPEEQMPALYRHAALYVFPSLFEGFGLSLPEAMACGTPTVCSNTSSLAEIGGDAVLTFPPESPERMAAAIIRALTEPELRQQMIERGLQRVKIFDWDHHAAVLAELYENQS
ncbi:MAG: glycosyltransferase family 1 protein, partial [Victivallales bacterium]|nr:glycosyltransferase family 1 protein [Victivallales bacterium]